MTALGGALARLIGGSGRAVAARPALYGGAAAFAAVAGLVTGNAVLYQPGSHPQPMLATRGLPPETDAAAAVPRTAAVRPAITNDPAIAPLELVADVQSLLASLGHYGLAIDGRAGRATDAAIRAFQRERGLTVNGVASPLLLTQLRQAVAERAPPATDARFASLEERMDAGETGGIADAAGEPDAELVRRIQSGLSAAQVAKLKADGILGEQTRSAIRTFQALEGLDVTGAPTEQLLSRLIEIGAAE